MAVREELIENAVEFLRDQKIAKSAPLAAQIIFLEGKGLTRDEIEQAILRTISRIDSSHLGKAPRRPVQFESYTKFLLSFIPLESILVSFK